MTDSAIVVEGLGKRYRIGVAEERSETIAQAALQWLGRPLAYARMKFREPREDEILWALKDVNFEVKRGEALGIIGANGSGKSTLLKILSRITEPTTGKADLYGRVGSLLEVGTGFHPELTGRENVYMNGAMLGMRIREIDRLFDDIVAFAGDRVSQMIDTPVKRYSSGMHVRLGFAVAAHIEPELLLIDEVLAVGDASFLDRSYAKIKEMRNDGRTILFVSHVTSSVVELCTDCVWLSQGQIQASGTPREIVHQYLASSLETEGGQEVSDGERTGQGDLRILKVEARTLEGSSRREFLLGAPLEIALSYAAGEGVSSLKSVSVSITVRDDDELVFTCMWTKHRAQDFAELPLEGELLCRIPRLTWAPGKYSFEIRVATPGEDSEDRLQDFVPKALDIEVLEADFYLSGRGTMSCLGKFVTDHSWSSGE